jgi:uncharacterized protein involved in type VI secretion and phage assembly
MANDAVSFGATQEFKAREPEEKIYGVTIAQVLNNIDCNGQARIQLMLPWLPGFQPWARLACQMAGSGAGTFFVPQIGEEVLVSFNHGDVREPYVLGSLWSTLTRPPSLLPTDAITTRKIRTPMGHELQFDDLLQSVTLTSSTQSTLTLDTTKAEISTPAATVTVGVAGDITITAATKLTLSAPVIEITADTLLTASSNLAATFEGKATCELNGQLVKIN